MNKAVEQASNALGQGFSAMVWHQVSSISRVRVYFIRIGIIFTGLGISKKFHVPFNHPTAFVVYSIMLVSIVASFIWGGLHVINPEYYAILELKGFIK
ncbi:hypothetical protein [Staphylococcus phage CH1]|uniref:Uncharacterized protein n=1 Tax=Staphylococcus phage CH1 TaxID=2510150 RepID=A0A411BLA1_9CAUD|nr:hypothetical protein [Staphylococcus phage CH1]